MLTRDATRPRAIPLEAASERPPTSIAPLDQAWFRRASAHQAQLTMPTGALGRLLPLGQQLCAIQETLQPRAEPAAVVVAAADHGVAEAGVSAYPQQVTGQMVANFLRGGAGINVLARRTGAKVMVLDAGVKYWPEELGAHPDLIRLPVAPGTKHFLHEPAMTESQAWQAIEAGREVADRLIADGIRVLLLGDMGIGNTTSASALTAVLTGKPIDEVTGRGTGVDDATWKNKCRVIEQAIARHRPSANNPITLLAALGGFEIAALAGLALRGAARRCTIVLDGFISSTAGLLAAQFSPAVREYMIAAHLGVEAGHRFVLAALDLSPILQLGLRLGEGTGAVLALPILQSAADVMRDMATFAAAKVSDRQERL